jgi:membrane fusion protein, multidrug efflux system
LKTLRKTLGVGISIAVVAAVVILGILAQQRLDQRPRTDDAYLQADLVHMAPDVSGRIVRLAIRNNQPVRSGEILFVIDPEPYQLQVEQATAQLRGLEAQRGVTADQVASQNSRADAASTGIGSAQAQLALATSTLARLEPLLPRGFVTAEQVDQARTAQRTAEIALQQARQQAQEARQGITSTKPIEGQIEAARVALALAQRNLRLTEVRAPCDGLVSGLDIAAGEFASAGHPLFTIIDTEHWYAVGNFRETQLGGISVGQRATIFVLSAPRRPLTGHVESLGWGVASDEGGLPLPGLPHVPRSLNWVRIAQRFPVRIQLDNPPPDLVRVGASVVIVVDR